MYERSNAVITIALLGVLAPATARAEVRNFPAGSLILPVDACYARSAGGPGNDTDVDMIIDYDPDDAVQSPTQDDLKCDTQAERDDGSLYTYGLILRLVHAGVPVYWIIKPGKTSWHEHDFDIRPGSLVRRSDFDTGAQTQHYNGVNSVQYRGGPFVIDAVDVPAAQALMATALYDTFDKGGVGPHVALAPFNAPVFVKITGIPKVAILDVDNRTDFNGGTLAAHVNAMNEVGLAWGQNDWWTVMSTADLRAGKLDSEGYQMLWVPPFDEFKGDNTTDNYNAITAFLTKTNPGWVLFQDTAIWAMEGYVEGTRTTARTWGPTQHSPSVLKIDGLDGTYGGNAAIELMRSDDYSDPFAQHGGHPWQGVGGANKAEWQPSAGPTLWNSGVLKAVYSYHTSDASLRNWVVASWRHFDNNTAYGKVLYTGGDNLRRNTFSPYRILLNSLLLQPTTTTTENLNSTTTTQVSRSSPTVDTVSGVDTVFQGTYDLENPLPTAPTYTGTASEPTFTFPFVRGRFFALNAEDFSGSVNYSNLVKIFEVDDYLMALTSPTTQRVLFTTLGSGHLPAKQAIQDTSESADALKASLSRPSPTTPFTTLEARGLIRRLFAGETVGTGSRARLGGVDRSSAVIVGTSRVAGSARPTVAYFGASDGMLHAVCLNDATPIAPCNTPGQELWAFIPKGQLGRLWNNTQRFDGSPQALDAFEDFDGDGLREWKTILVFQTGNAKGQPEAYALDITDPTPTAVSVIWQRDLPGSGLTAAVGPVQRGSGFAYMAFFLTNNGRDPTLQTPNAPGIRVTAVDIKNGSFATATATDEIATRGFQFSRTYPIGSRTLEGTDLNSLASGIPDGAAAVDLEDGGTITHLVFGTLTGEMFRIPATSTGTLSTTIEPLFSFEDNYHPIGATPTIYREITGEFHAVVVSGGYADPVMTSWSPPTENQYAISVELEHSGATIVKPETMTTPVPGLDWAFDLGTGDRAYAAATRIGDQIFVTTQNADQADVNSATYGLVGVQGKLHQITLQGVAATDTVYIAGGATSVSVVPQDKVYVAGAQKMEEVVAAVQVGEGRSGELTYIIRNIRKLWLKLE